MRYGARKRSANPVRPRPRFPVAEEGATGGWKPLRSLLPYLWPSGAPSLRLRVLLALAALVAAKVASVYIPVFYGRGRGRPLARHRRRWRRPGGAPSPLPCRWPSSSPTARRGFSPRVQRSPRRHLHQRRATGDPHRRARSVPPPPRALDALPPRAADGEAVALDRARHAGDRDPAAALQPVRDLPHRDRAEPRVRHPVERARRGHRAHHHRGGGPLHRVPP